MKINELIDLLDSKPKKPESMSIDKFMSLLTPSEKDELKKVESEVRKKAESKKKKQKK